MHPRLIGNKAGGVGDCSHFDHRFRAIHELDQHTRVHVTGIGFCLVAVGRRIDVQRIILTLARGYDLVSHRRDKLDKLHTGRRLVSCTQRIDNAQPVGLRFKIGADGNIRLDIHHDQMLALLHRLDPQLGTNPRQSSSLDYNVQ